MPADKLLILQMSGFPVFKKRITAITRKDLSKSI